MNLQVFLSDSLSSMVSSISKNAEFHKTISDQYAPRDYRLFQPFRNLSVVIKSTRTQQKTLTTTAKYTDSLTPTVITPGDKILLVQIQTNSSYRG